MTEKLSKIDKIARLTRHNLDVVVVPIAMGGGGLCAGIATAVNMVEASDSPDD